MKNKIVRINEVAKKLGLSRATIWRRIKDDETFPQPVRLGFSQRSAVGLLETEVNCWLKKSAQNRHKKANKGDNK